MGMQCIRGFQHVSILLPDWFVSDLKFKMAAPPLGLWSIYILCYFFIKPNHGIFKIFPFHQKNTDKRNYFLPSENVRWKCLILAAILNIKIRKEILVKIFKIVIVVKSRGFKHFVDLHLINICNNLDFFFRIKQLTFLFLFINTISLQRGKCSIF